MIHMSEVKHILLSRVDNIGDVVLTLPMVSVLKAHYPDLKVSFLVRDYTADIVRLHPGVDSVISWDQLSAISEKKAVEFLRSLQIDCVIHVYPKQAIASLMRRAGVEHRVGTFRRFYHWWNCNRLVDLSRANSQVHEAILNLKLLKPLGIDAHCKLSELSESLRLKNDVPLSTRLREFLHPDKFNLIIHPFTNGNTQEWPISQFNALIRQLPKDRFNILITGSDKEADQIKQRIVTQCPHVVNVAGQCTLSELSQLIAHVDGLVANSTGPMHMAAVLGIRTLGLFPSGYGTDSAARWAPIGTKATYLSADSNCQLPRCQAHSECLCMESITVRQVESLLLNWL